MRKILLATAVAAVMLVCVRELQAGTLAGVTLPESEQIGSKTLVLNGMGLRTKFVVKVYVAGLYLEQKSSDAGAVLKTDGTKRVVMHFMRDVSKKQLADAFGEGFENNNPDMAKSMKAEIDRLLGALEPVKEGDKMTFTYVPGTGTTMSVNGKEKVTVAGPAFSSLVFALWLGPKPPNESLKKGMLGA